MSILSHPQLLSMFISYIRCQRTLEQYLNLMSLYNSLLSVRYTMLSVEEKLKTCIMDLEKKLCLFSNVKKMHFYEHVPQEEQVFISILDAAKSSFQDQEKQIVVKLFSSTLQKVPNRENIFVTGSQKGESELKLAIYNKLVLCAEEKQLFDKNNHNIVDEKPKRRQYTDNVFEVFPPRDLQLIMSLFKQNNCNVVLTYKKLIKKGVKGIEYKNQIQFISRFDNLLLIGLYKVQVQRWILQDKVYHCWGVFKQIFYPTVNFRCYLQTLVRAAIRESISNEEALEISNFVQIKGQFPKNQKFSNIQSVRRRKQKRFIKKYYKEIKGQIFKNQKIIQE